MANSYNETGYWESDALRQVNDAVLASLGGSWARPAPLTDEWFATPSYRRLRRRAVNAFHQVYAFQRVWAWKDPRTCLLLPFWRRVLKRATTVAIVVYRNPLEVASSLEKRNKMSCDVAVKLWERYMTSALDAAELVPNIVVSYENLLTMPLETVAAIRSLLVDNRIPLEPEAQESSILELVDPELRHASISRAELVEHDDVDEISLALFDRLEALNAFSRLRADPADRS